MHKSHLRRRPVRTLAVIVALSAMAFAGIASAAEVVVTQNSAGWTEDDTRAGGQVEWTEEYGAPPGLGEGSLKLTTPLDTASKAGLYNHDMLGTPLASVNTLAYWTYQAANISASARCRLVSAADRHQRRSRMAVSRRSSTSRTRTVPW